MELDFERWSQDRVSRLETMSTDTPQSADMSPDLVFEILSNTRRRMVLYYLRQQGGPVSVQELAGEIAAIENDVSVDELTRQQRKRVYVSLYQTHLPKLEDTGIIQYDDDGEEVQLTDRAHEMDSYLTPTSTSDPSWQKYYLFLAAAGGLVFALSLLGVPGFTAIPPLGLGIALMFGFGILAGVQYWRTRQRREELPAELLNHDQ